MLAYLTCRPAHKFGLRLFQKKLKLLIRLPYLGGCGFTLTPRCESPDTVQRAVPKTTRRYHCNIPALKGHHSPGVRLQPEVHSNRCEQPTCQGGDVGCIERCRRLPCFLVGNKRLQWPFLGKEWCSY